MIHNRILLQGKGKKRAVGWFPASYVKLLEGGVGGGGAEKKQEPAEASKSSIVAMCNFYLRAILHQFVNLRYIVSPNDLQDLELFFF